MKNIKQNKITNLHKTKLGLDTPDDYFKTSKNDILNAVFDNKKQKVHKLKPLISYAIAASLILMLSIAFWLKSNYQNNNKTNSIELANTIDNNSTDYLLSSLLINENELNEFTDKYIVNNIIVEAEISEQKLENIFMNSLFVEDSLIDSYVEENIVNQIIL